MPFDVTPHIEPTRTAVVALEVQEGVLDADKSFLPGLARSAADDGLVPRLAELYACARRAGTRVVYVLDKRRGDGLGGPTNLMTGHATKGQKAWFVHGDVVVPLAPQPEDIVIAREHGMTGFYTTPLDAYLRNLGITSVILTGVSANIAVVGTAIEAMNLGYRVIVASDGIASDPPDYKDQLLRYTIRNVALVSPVQPIMDYWNALELTPPT
jgi:nicotinamidase-related amidase